jgi:hypothetical protein
MNKEYKVGDLIAEESKEIKELKIQFLIAKDNFEKALTFEFEGYKGNIRIYEARFIAEGSFSLIQEDGKEIIEGYVENKIYKYYGIDLSDSFKEYLNNKIAEIYELKNIKDKLLMRIMKGE